MTTILPNDQKVKGQINPTDKNGKSAKVEAGTVKYESSDEGVFTVTPDADDETKFEVVAVGNGTATLKVTADADLGEGVTNIEGSADILVEDEQATGFGFTFSTPENQ